MKKEIKAPILELIISELRKIANITRRSEKWDRILFWLVLTVAFYLGLSFIYLVKITSYIDKSQFIEIYKVPLIAEAFSVLVGILLIPIKKRNQKKLRSLPVTAIREIFERGEVPSLIIPLSEQEDPYLDLIEQVFPNIKDFQTEILDGRTLDTLLRISSLIDWDQDIGILRDVLSSEITSLSEQERAEFVKKFSELEKFFSEL